MSVGLEITKSSLDANAGQIAYTLEKVFRQAAELKAYTDRYTAQDLATLYGYSETEANVLKSAFGEAAIVQATYEQNKTFLSQLSGLGDVA
jgi:predicted phage-related endonuclease